MNKGEDYAQSQNGDFVVKRESLQFGNRMFDVAGPTEWSFLPEPILRSFPINTFETKLKTCFLITVPNNLNNTM